MFDFSTPVRGEPVEVTLPPRFSDRADPGTILRRLWRGASFIVLGGLFMVAAAVALLGLLTPVYTSSIQILVDPSDLRVVDNDVSARTPQADSGVSLAESQTKVIQSDNVLRRTVEKLDLDRDDEFAKPESDNPTIVWLRTALGMLPPPGSRDPVNVAVDTLQTKLTVRRAERTFVIDVLVQSRDPEKAAKIANAIGDAYFAEEASARTEAARRASDALNGRLSSLRRDVELAEGKLLKYREDNNLVASSGRLLTDQQLGDLNQQLVTAQIKTAESRSRLEQARKMKAGDASTALPEMLQSLEMQALRQQYATLSRNTAELATRLGERHPAMAEQYAQQRDLQRLIQREKERIIETTQKDYDRAAASETAIRKSLDRAKAETVTSDRANVGLRELERTLESRRGVYETYLRRSREASEQERLNSINVRIISPAVPARTRTWPPSPKVVLPLALLVGMMLGVAIALSLGAARDRRNDRNERRAATVPPRSFELPMLEAGQAQAEDDGAVKVAGFAIHPAMPRPRAVRGTSRLEPGHAAGATPETPMDRRSEAGSAWRVRMFGHDFAAGPAAGILAASAMQPSAGPRLVVTANIDHIVLLSENAAFRQAYAGAVARTLDGTPLVWLARLRGQPAARVTGHDLLAHALFARPVEGRRVFLVCSREAVAEAIRDRLERSGYDADAVATCVPPFGFDDDAEYGRALSARIREHGTTLLVMGVGAPRSEVWVTRQGAALGTPLVLAVGEAVNVAAGLVPRAPVMLQRAGLEWAFRFAFAPRRLFRRYFVRSWRFLALLRGEIGNRDAA